MLKNQIEYAFLKQDNKQIKIYPQTTIGRGTTNIINIADHTVSKNHATITYVKTHHSTQQVSQKCFIMDLGSVNGTFVNGIKLQSEDKKLLKHLDVIQFGKSDNLYTFIQKRPKPQKIPTKINLKDYYYDAPEPKNSKTTQNFFPKHQQTNFEPNHPLYQQERPKSSSKNRPKEGKIKIPDLSEFLTVKNPLEQQKISNPTKKNINYNEQHKQQIRKKKQDKINFTQLSHFFSNNTEELQKNAQMNIYLRQQQAIKREQERKRKIQEDKLKAQIQRAKQQELLLRKQQQMQKKLQQQEQKLNEQRRRVEEEIFFRAKQREQEQQRMKEEAVRREKQYIEKLRQQKQRQITDIKQKQEQARLNQQRQLKENYERKKRDLQIQAEALAQQYQNIYKETIEKVKANIQKQQQQIESLEQSIESYVVEGHKLKQVIQSKTQLSEQLKRQYMIANSRNRSLLLYASELQNRIDSLKNKSSQQADGLRAKHKLNRNQQIKQSITHSRKLLQIKKNQAKKLQFQLKKLKSTLISNNLINGSVTYLPQKVKDYLQTILQNSQSISSLKQQYYQYVQQQKNLEDSWQQQLSAHNQLQQLQRSHQIQVNNNVKAIQQNLKDDFKKMCEQRLGMLKAVQPLLNQPKRKAAKFLIEEIVQIENQVNNIIIKNEQAHVKIGKIILQSQALKKQNTYLSELLFGQATAHHLDNMKTIINELIDKIQGYKQSGTVNNCLKLSNEILNTQLKIQEQFEKNKILKAQQLKYIHSGLANKIISLQGTNPTSRNNKNPINFFSEILLRKDNEIALREQNIKKTKNEIEQLHKQLNFLETKKQKMNFAFQNYKRAQMEEARSWMIK